MQHLILRVKRAYVATRPENFFANHGGILRQTRPYGRLYPKAVGQVALHVGHAATDDNRGAIVHRSAVVGQHLFLMLFADQRSQIRHGIVWRSDFQCLSSGFQTMYEIIEDRPLHIDALGRQALLAAIGEDRADRPFDSLVHIAVGKHDSRILATECCGLRVSRWCPSSTGGSRT